MKTSDSARGRGFESHPLRHNLESPLGYDIYPLYWTTSKGGILMRYSYEFKRKAIELFYQGEWPKTPNDVRTDTFHRLIRDWVKLERLYGSQWVHKYKTLGYNGLINKPKGRIKILQ